MIRIEIGGTPLANRKARLYKAKGQRGDHRYVSTYRLTMIPDTTSIIPNLFLGYVTRDTSPALWDQGPGTRYGIGGECPPSIPGKPYCAVPHTSETIPFGLRLFEPEYGDERHLRGQGDTIRSDMLVHFGPARSEGCFTIAGGRRGMRRWQKELEEWMAKLPDPEIRVTVMPRDTPF